MGHSVCTPQLWAYGRLWYMIVLCANMNQLAHQTSVGGFRYFILWPPGIVKNILVDYQFIHSSRAHITPFLVVERRWRSSVASASLANTTVGRHGMLETADERADVFQRVFSTVVWHSEENAKTINCSQFGHSCRNSWNVSHRPSKNAELKFQSQIVSCPSSIQHGAITVCPEWKCASRNFTVKRVYFKREWTEAKVSLIR